jgi:phage repressor protein C with HTH and peptisase S24 domain
VDVEVMARSINRQLTKRNRQLLHVEHPASDHQPMVETMADRLRQMKGDLSYEAFGELAGVTGQTVQKWMDGGGASDEVLERLVNSERFRGQAYTVPWIRYGVQAQNKYLYPRAYENVIAGLGPGRFNDDFHVEVAGAVAIPSSLVGARGWRVERLAVVKTEGLSMYPTLGENEPVVVYLDDVKLVSGKVYAIEDEDEGLRIKRLFRQSDRRIRVVCDNPDKMMYPDDWITPDTKTRIVGRVVYRSGEL